MVATVLELAIDDSAALVEQARLGSVPAFDRLVERYQDAVFGVAYSMLGNFHDAQDVAQDVFIQAWRSLSSLREAEKFPGWLYRSTQNRCRNLITRSRQETLSPEQIERHMPAPTPDDPAISTVRDAIAGLSTPNRLATTLFYLAGYNVAEIAALLEVPQGTVKRRLHDSRKQLRSSLDTTPRDGLAARLPSHDPRFMHGVIVFNAAITGDAVRLRPLLAATPDLARATTGDGWTPLHYAAQGGHDAAAACLLLAGADAEAREHGWGWTPLHLAIANGHTALADRLRAAGATLDLTAAAALGDVARVLELMNAADAAGPVQGAGPLHWAAYRGQDEVVALLLGHGADPNARSTNRFANTPLHCAVLNRHVNVVRRLLAAGARVWTTDGEGGTPLHDLAKYPHDDPAGADAEITDLLLHAGFAIDATNAVGETALHWAATRGEKRVAALLLARGAQLDAFAAAGLDLMDELRLLLDHDPALVAAHGPDNMTALHCAAYGNSTAAAQLLIERGAPVDALGGWFGGTALHLAAYQGHRAMVELLLAHGADPHARDAAGWTPLHAFRFSWWTPLGDRAGIAAVLLAHGADANARNDAAETPLHLAAEQGDLALVDMLLAHGAQADASDAARRTALVRAARYAHYEVVHRLAYTIP